MDYIYCNNAIFKKTSYICRNVIHLEEKNLKLIYSAVNRRYEEENEKLSKYNEKAMQIAAFVGTVIGLSVQLLSLNLKLNTALFILSQMFFLASILSALVVLIPTSYRADPNPEKLVEKYANKSYKNTLHALSLNVAESANYNNRRNTDKGKTVSFSLMCLFVGILFSALLILLLVI